MSYRLPRFSYRHMLREVGDAGFSASTDAFASTTPRARLFDDASRQLAGPTTNVDWKVWFHRAGTGSSVASTHPYQLNRILIPANHNFGVDRELRIRTNADGDESTFLTPALVDGALHTRIAPSSGIIDWELAASQAHLSAEMLELMVYAANSATIGRLGELWWTQTVQPSAGEVPEWDDYIVPTQERFSLRSGAAYINDTGQDLRFFSLSHIVDGGSADDKLYHDLVRRTTGKPFWYEHPDSGDAVSVLDDLETLANVSAPSELTMSVVSGGAPDGVSDCIQAQSNDVTPPSVDVSVGITSTDVRDSILQFDLKIVSSAAWLNLAADCQLYLAHDSGNNLNAYNLAPALLSKKPVDEWVRFQIDIENDVTLSGLQTSLDPSRLTLAFFRFYFDVIGQSVRIANLRFISKRKQPKLVEMVSARRRQISAVPTSGTFYRYDLEMLEVSS